MSDARREILAKIRTTRSSPNAVKNELGTIRQRLQDHPVNLIPARGKKPKSHRVAQFIDEAERVNATTCRISRFDDIPAEIARYLAEHNLPTRLKQAPSLATLDWKNTLIDVSQGVASETDEVSLTWAVAGVAETGTLVTYSGTENPTTLNFLPPVHVIVLRTEDVVGAYEDAWSLMREKLKNKDHPNNFIPRTVNFITGPSRTGDIQQTLLLGIHGPQRLHIVIIDEEDT